MATCHLFGGTASVTDSLRVLVDPYLLHLRLVESLPLHEASVIEYHCLPLRTDLVVPEKAMRNSLTSDGLGTAGRADAF